MTPYGPQGNFSLISNDSDRQTLNEINTTIELCHQDHNVGDCENIPDQQYSLGSARSLF